MNNLIIKTIKLIENITNKKIKLIENIDNDKLLKLTEKEFEKLYQKDWKKFTPQICNTGACDIWAEQFIKHYGGRQLSTNIKDDYKSNGHTIVKLNNKYYDAEIPVGTNKLIKIPYFKRAKELYEELTEEIIENSLEY